MNNSTYSPIWIKKIIKKDKDGKKIFSFIIVCEDTKFYHYIQSKVLCNTSFFQCTQSNLSCDFYEIILQEKNEQNNLSQYVEFCTFEHTYNSLEGNKTDSGKNISKRKSTLLKRPFRKPTLHWAMYDLFAISETSLEIIYYKPRYIKYLDSSIWNYFFPIFIWDTNRIDGQNEWKYNRDTERFVYILNNIWENTHNDLYNYSNTNEYYELNTRLVENAYLVDYAHGQAVSPFIFHSEYEIKKELNLQARKKIKIYQEVNYSKKRESTNKNNINKNFHWWGKWRILLLDDYANKPLKRQPDTNSKYSYNIQSSKKEVTGKLKIIIDDLQSQGYTNIVWCYPTKEEISNKWNEDLKHKSWHWYDINGNRIEESTQADIAIVCTVNVKDAFALLMLQRYDIILLDYLLDKLTDNNTREYSYYLLKIIDDIYQNKIDKSLCNALGIKLNLSDNIYKLEVLEGQFKNINIKKLMGPNGKLYFMYISAFVTAISERLQEQSLIRDTNYWHIGRGACPTNTPQLFLYYLYRLMEKRYSEMVFDEAEGIYVHTLIDLLDVIFISEPGKIKGNATKYFNTLLNLRRKYNLMKNDIYPDEFSNKDWLNRRGSLLVYSLFPDIQYYSNSFWEHIQQLIYLTAYGTIRQWPEMWEEYIFVRESLKKAETDIKERREKRIDDKGDMPSVQIEKYIIQLKNA